jgi:ABC-2 type transport system permease protein
MAAALVILAVGAAAGLHLAVSRLVAAFLGAVLLCILHGYVALLVGAATGSRAAAIGVSAAAFTAGYLLQALAGLVSWLRPLRAVSPFYLYNGSMPIAHGFALGHVVVLLSLCTGALFAAVTVFDRRDLPA